MAEKEYIEREAMVKESCERCIREYVSCDKEHCILMEVIYQIPAADVRPVVRGKWVDEPIKGIRYYCSVCQGRFDYRWHYCPNCGADMRGEADEKA